MDSVFERKRQTKRLVGQIWRNGKCNSRVDISSSDINCIKSNCKYPIRTSAEHWTNKLNFKKFEDEEVRREERKHMSILLHCWMIFCNFDVRNCLY